MKESNIEGLASHDGPESCTGVRKGVGDPTMISMHLGACGAQVVTDDAADLVKIAEKCKSQDVSMTKADLITIIADKLKFPWARAELLVDMVFGCLEQSMSRGKKIEIRATHPNYPYTQPLPAMATGS